MHEGRPILRFGIFSAGVMTRYSLNDRLRPPLAKKVTGKIARTALLSGLLTSLLIVAGCSGSKLGDSVGKSLEPDPQLAEKNPTEGNKTPEATAPTPTPSTDNKTESATKPAAETVKVKAGDYIDLGKAPEEIQPYLVDLIDLDLLKIRPPAARPASTGNSSSPDGANKAKPTAPPNSDEFRPNQATTRREYARWLLAVNNRFYAGQSNRKVRPGVTSSTPVFKDLSTSDPDFSAIQGLAEAGIIPSPLTGSSTTLTFRPDAPLTRQDLLLWKVPLDTRQPLPQATPAAVQEAWGFQDAAKIEPRALQAVLADYQNGDFANIRRAFGYTTLFQPTKAATRAEAAAVLWRFGNSTEGTTAADVLGTGSDSQQTPEANSGVQSGGQNSDQNGGQNGVQNNGQSGSQKGG